MSRKDEYRKRRLMSHYGITTIEYDAMLWEQGGGCAICMAPPSDNKALAVDHLHDMQERGGKLVDVNKGNRYAVRGLLCASCNTGIGMLRDSAKLLRIAADYIDNN